VKSRVDLRTHVGSVPLPNPVLTASGTAGHGAELASYVDLATLGAVVVKSLSVLPWPGNPAPRVHETPAGMLNSVGLQGSGVAAWLARELPALNDRGARVVASIWGRSAEEYAQAAAMLDGVPGIVAVEVNVSCPNVEDRGRMFAHSGRATAQVVSASASSGLPLWVKLSPNVPDIVEIAGAALEAGAETLVLVNTVLGMAIDVTRRRYRLGSGPAGGGLSGPAIRPVAVRAVHDCRAAFPHAGIVGVGGVSRGVDAVEMLLAGADAVEVGTATFRDPRAPARVLAGLARWCRVHGVGDVRGLVGAVHGSRAAAPAMAQSAEVAQSPHVQSPEVAPTRDMEQSPDMERSGDVEQSWDAVRSADAAPLAPAPSPVPPLPAAPAPITAAPDRPRPPPVTRPDVGTRLPPIPSKGRRGPPGVDDD
jgi:dihydroorotate dehydrogenase (NAD+) catalytic subunit